jgi:hypothetical protein
VIEYQHRGLPHCHIVFRLSNHPIDDIAARTNYFGEHICARFTEMLEHANPTENVLHQKYQNLIQKHMIHKCSDGVNGCKNKRGLCKRGYMTRECTSNNSFGEDGMYLISKFLCPEY